MWHPPRPSSQTTMPTQNPPDHATRAQPRLTAFSQAYAPTLPGPSGLSRPEVDALHSPQHLLPLAPVQSAFELLSLKGNLEDQQHYSTTEVAGSRQMNQSSFAGLPPSTMYSEFSSQPDAQNYPSKASLFSAPTLSQRIDRHPAAFATPPLLIPLQPGSSFHSGAHFSLSPTAVPYHHPAHTAMPFLPGSKTLDQRFPLSATQGGTTFLGHPSPGPRSISHSSQPLVKTSEPSRKLPYRAITETGFVMWVGNLESSASLDELYIFFRKIDPIPLTPGQSAVVSIMYMPGTNCALVNMRNEATLVEAVERFHGSRLRPNTKSARLVCRRRGGGGELGSESSLVKPRESAPSRWG